MKVYTFSCPAAPDAVRGGAGRAGGRLAFGQGHRWCLAGQAGRPVPNSWRIVKGQGRACVSAQAGEATTRADGPWQGRNEEGPASLQRRRGAGLSCRYEVPQFFPSRRDPPRDMLMLASLESGREQCAGQPCCPVSYEEGLYIFVPCRFGCRVGRHRKGRGRLPFGQGRRWRLVGQAGRPAPNSWRIVKGQGRAEHASLRRQAKRRRARTPLCRAGTRKAPHSPSAGEVQGFPVVKRSPSSSPPGGIRLSRSCSGSRGAGSPGTPLCLRREDGAA